MKLLVVSAMTLVCASLVGAADDPPKGDLVELTAAYVERFLDGFSNVVAEEHYTQEATVNPRRRTLRADVALVRYPGSTEWYVFRDVFEIDGKLIRDPRNERLVHLFLTPPQTALRSAQEITIASARHNLRNIGTVNNPLMTLSFLQPKYRERFHFILAGRDRKAGPGVRKIRFEEFRVSTILKQAGNRDLPARGFIWAEESTGRIVKTELRLGGREVDIATDTWQPPTTIITTFGLDEQLGITVPLEMRDKYPLERVDVKGVAKYSRFRRFQIGSEMSQAQNIAR